MNSYKKMYVICEDEYRRLKEMSNEATKVANEATKVDDVIKVEKQIVTKRYKCGECDKDYSDKHDLRRHKKKAHAKVSINKIEDTFVEEAEVPVLQKVTTRKQRNKRRPLREIFKHLVKKWKTL